jgi:hypothetical protein
MSSSEHKRHIRPSTHMQHIELKATYCYGHVDLSIPLTHYYNRLQCHFCTDGFLELSTKVGLWALQHNSLMSAIFEFTVLSYDGGTVI